MKEFYQMTKDEALAALNASGKWTVRQPGRSGSGNLR